MAASGFKHRAKRRHTELRTNHHQGGQSLHPKGLSSYARPHPMGSLWPTSTGLSYGRSSRSFCVIPARVHPNALIGQHHRFIYGVESPVLIHLHMKPCRVFPAESSILGSHRCKPFGKAISLTRLTTLGLKKPYKIKMGQDNLKDRAKGNIYTSKAPEDDESHQMISSLFLGPHAENYEYFKSNIIAILETTRDARLNYFPEDGVRKPIRLVMNHRVVCRRLLLTASNAYCFSPLSCGIFSFPFGWLNVSYCSRSLVSKFKRQRPLASTPTKSEKLSKKLRSC